EGRSWAGGRAVRRRGRLWGATKMRTCLHHSGAVRPAPYLRNTAGGRQGRYGYGRRPQADRRYGCLSRAATFTARSGSGTAVKHFYAAAAGDEEGGGCGGRGGAGRARRA